MVKRKTIGDWGYREWLPSDKIMYVMWRDGFRYDLSGGRPLYKGSWERGFDTLNEACVYTVYYLAKNRPRVKADELSVIEINTTLYKDAIGDPEEYEGKWYDYPQVRKIANKVLKNTPSMKRELTLLKRW
jgi:hypothetical protein